MVHGRFWLVNVICLLNCDNERDLCQLLDAAFAVGWSWDVGFRLADHLHREGRRLLIGIMRLLNALKREPKAGL